MKASGFRGSRINSPMASLGIMDRNNGKATRKTVSGSRGAASAMGAGPGGRGHGAMDTFLARLVQRQTALDLSDRRLARLLQIDSTTMSRWKRHKGAPRIDHVVRLARVLRCDAAWLLGVGGERAGPATGLDEASYEAGVREGVRRCRLALGRAETNGAQTLQKPERIRKM